MQTNCPTNVANVKLFAVPEAPRLRRINLWIEETVDEDIREIAQYEDLDFSATTRELLAIGLRYYQYKRGTLNPDLPQNNKLLYCQVCAQPTKVRKIHTLTVLNEEYKFCEDCFFSDKHKAFVIRMISRS